jgi:hypothetical protein
MKNKVTLFSLLTATLLAGCSTVSEPIRIGQDAYQLNSISKSGLASWGEVKDMAIIKANQYCESQGKDMILDDEKTSGVKVWTHMESHIKFRCVPK